MEKKLNPLAQRRLGRLHLWLRPNFQWRGAHLGVFLLLLSALGYAQSQVPLTNPGMCAERGGRWDSNSVQCKCVDEQGRVLPIGSPAPRTPNCATRRSNAYYCELIERELNGSGGLGGRVRRRANQIVRGRAATYSTQTGYCQCSPRVYAGDLSAELTQRIPAVCQGERN
jgi:hypothetical protein